MNKDIYEVTVLAEIKGDEEEVEEGWNAILARSE
jgi:hypothetical protein